MQQKYSPTNHAVERYKERVGGRGKGEVLRHHATNWLNQVLPVSEPLFTEDNGRTHHRYKQFDIVCDGHTVVTITYVKAAELPFAEELSATLKAKLSRMMKPYRTLHRKLTIEMYEAEIRKLKVFNPNTQAIIDETITEIRRDIAAVENRLNDLEKLAKNYGVEV